MSQLIVSFLADPTDEKFNKIVDKELAFKLLNMQKDSVPKLKFLYEHDRLSVYKLLEQTLKDNDRLFFDLKDKIVYSVGVMRMAVKYNRIEAIDYLLEKVKVNNLAFFAAEFSS